MTEMFERFVTAIEALVGCWKEQNSMYRELMVKNEKPEEPEPPNPANQMDDRAFVKAKLDEMGVSYPAKARTETLVSLLETETKKRLETETVKLLEEAVTAPAEPESLPSYTMEDCRKALKKVSEKHGRDFAYKILKEQCDGATGLMQVKPELFPQLITACDQAA